MKTLLNQLGTVFWALVIGLSVFSLPVSALTVPAPSFTIFAETVTPQEKSAIIAWKTDLPTKGQVEYSGPNGQWVKTPWTQEYHYEHAFTILDLQPGTRYLYRINAEDVYGTTTSETDVFVAPGLEKQTTPLVMPTSSAVLGEQVAQQPTATPAELAQLKETSVQYPQSVSTNAVSQALLLLGGIVVGAGAVWLYQKSPHKLSITVVSTNPKKTSLIKEPKPVKEEPKKVVADAKEKKVETPKPVVTPKLVESKPNRFQFKINQ